MGVTNHLLTGMILQVGPDFLSVQVLLPRSWEIFSLALRRVSWDRDDANSYFFLFPPRISIFVDTFNELFFLWFPPRKFLEDVHFMTIYPYYLKWLFFATRPLVTGRPLVHFFVLVGAEVEKYEWFLVFDDGGFPIIAAWPDFDDGSSRSVA